MGFFSSIRKFFGTPGEDAAKVPAAEPEGGISPEEAAAPESVEAETTPAPTAGDGGDDAGPGRGSDDLPGQDAGQDAGESAGEDAAEESRTGDEEPAPLAGPEPEQESGGESGRASGAAAKAESAEREAPGADAAPVPESGAQAPAAAPEREETGTEPASVSESVPEAPAAEPEKKGFFASLKRVFSGGGHAPAPAASAGEADAEESGAGEEPEPEPEAAVGPPAAPAAPAGDPDMLLRLRNAPPRLSAWLDIILEGVPGAGETLNGRVLFLLRALDAPEDEARKFVDEFASWLTAMEYRELDEFRSELQYRLAIALDLEDEEDERSRLLLKLANGLAKTRESFSRSLESVFAGHGELDEGFWEELEELFIVADLGYEAAMRLVERLRERARAEGVTTTEGVRALLHDEIRAIFAQPRRIQAVTPPEVVLMIGVNGAGKTTTIAKLAYRDKMQGRKVMIAAADTFRAAAIDQMRVWSERVGTLFHAKQPGADPASVAYEAMGRAMEEGVDVLYVDTAGRLQTKVNLMDELAKIRQVIAKRHPGAPHRTVLVLDATTGQNALSQVKLFKESAGVDELVLTKLDGTAKGGVAIAVAMQYGLPISFVGLGEKVEDLRPFNGDDYADVLLKSA